MRIDARYVHLVCSDQPPSDPMRGNWQPCCDYGEPYAGATEGPLVVVTPRLGTVSPWASKATDIAHNCGLLVRRIERIVEFRLTLKSHPAGAACRAERGAAAADGRDLLHDRMTESVMFDRAGAGPVLGIGGARAGTY